MLTQMHDPCRPLSSFPYSSNPTFQTVQLQTLQKRPGETKKCTADCMATLSQNHAPQQPPLIN